MGIDSAPAPKANGLKTAFDMLVSPKEALEQLRVAPTWGWAFILSVLMYALGSYLVTPAVVHATQADWPSMVASNPAIAQLTPEQQKANLGIVLKIVEFTWVFSIVLLPIILLVQTIVLVIFKAIGRGDASFGKLWALATNVAVPGVGLNALVLAAIVMLRGPDSFNKVIEVQTAMPSLALLVPSAGVKLHAFLSLFNPFTLWGIGLLIAGLTIVARVPRAIAWAGGILVLVVSAGLVALGAK